MNGWKYPYPDLRYHPILDEYQFLGTRFIRNGTEELKDFLDRYEDCSIDIYDDYGDDVIRVDGWGPLSKEEFESLLEQREKEKQIKEHWKNVSSFEKFSDKVDILLYK